jgi:hypothetical protein
VLGCGERGSANQEALSPRKKDTNETRWGQSFGASEGIKIMCEVHGPSYRKFKRARQHGQVREVSDDQIASRILTGLNNCPLMSYMSSDPTHMPSIPSPSSVEVLDGLLVDDWIRLLGLLRVRSLLV